MTKPVVMVQNLPAKESAMTAPMIGVRLPVPEKLVSVVEALTRGMCSSWVRYVIMLAWKPVAANLSQNSLAGNHQTNKKKKTHITQISLFHYFRCYSWERDHQDDWVNFT